VSTSIAVWGFDGVVPLVDAFFSHTSAFGSHAGTCTE